MSGTLTVRVQRRWNEAEGIDGFELVNAAGGLLPPFAAGAHIQLHLGPQLTGGSVLKRPYSLCNAPPAAGQGATHYELGVLREPASRGGSAAVHASLQPGLALQIDPPRNLFPLAAPAAGAGGVRPAAPDVLLAGGIGITPVLSMADALWAQGRPFVLHHAVRSARRAPYRARMASAPWAAQARLHLDDGPPEQGLVLAEVLAHPQPGQQLYCCGPTGFMQAVRQAAAVAGWADDQVHWESFGAELPAAAAAAADSAASAPAGAGAAATADRPFELVLARSGRSLTVATGQSVLAALRAAGLDQALPTSCEQGVCGTCLCTVLEGRPDHRDHYLTPEEQAEGGQMLPCCSRSLTPRLVLDL